MTCERYWRDGILRAERGDHDPHRDTCDDCRRAHRAREQIIRALPRVGAATPGDPDWQTQVWSRIARQETRRVRRSYWLGGALAACAIAVVCLCAIGRSSETVGIDEGRARRVDDPIALAQMTEDLEARRRQRDWRIASIGSTSPQLEIVSGRDAKRSTSARVGDRVRIAARPGSELRLYRADRLILRCPAWRRSPGCAPDLLGLVADAELATPGEYQVVLIPIVTAEPIGALDDDLAAVVRAGGEYRTIDLSVR
jgi:hypothetical protein